MSYQLKKTFSEIKLFFMFSIVLLSENSRWSFLLLLLFYACLFRFDGEISCIALLFYDIVNWNYNTNNIISGNVFLIKHSHLYWIHFFPLINILVLYCIVLMIPDTLARSPFNTTTTICVWIGYYLHANAFANVHSKID